MVRLVCGLILVLSVACPSFAQQSLVGTYKIISQDVQVEGAALQPLGKAPHGYVVITPTRWVAFYTSDNRKFGTSAADKAALLDTLVGWSGKYRIEGSKMIITVDASWTEAWNGRERGSPLDTLRQSAYVNRRPVILSPEIHPKQRLFEMYGRRLNE